MSTPLLNWSDKKNSPLLADFIAKYGTEYCMTAEEINEMRDAINAKLQISDSKTVVATTTTPTPDIALGNVNATVGPGTYPNWGGMVVPDNNQGTLQRIGGVFSVSLVPVALGDYAKKSDITSKADLVPSINLLNVNSSNVILNKYIVNNGTLADSIDYDVSDYIPVNPINQYTRSNLGVGISFNCYYTSDKTVISTFGSTPATFTTPSNCAYIRVSIPKSTKSIAQIELGSVATSFVSYNQTLKPSQINSDTIKEILLNGNNLIPSSVSEDKTTFFIRDSSNLFNPNDPDFVLSFYLDGNGLPNNPSTSYDTTGYILVNEGDIIVIGNNGVQFNVRFINGYDINKVNINGSDDATRTSYIVPANVKYVRISFAKTNTLFQVQKTKITSYTPYLLKYILKTEYLEVEDNSISNSKLKNGAVTENKTIMFEESKNLFNPDEAVIGSYIGSTNGTLTANVSYNSTGFIPVVAGENYTLSYKNQIAWYDSSKVYISGSSNADSNKTQIAPASAAFLRCSINLANYSTFQVEKGSSQTAYEAFGYYLKKRYVDKYLTTNGNDKYESILGKQGKIVTQSILTSGNIIEITDFPFHLKKGISISFYADLTLNGTVSFGKGFGKYRGEYYTIDSVNISYFLDSVLQLSKPHNLTISIFLKGSFSTDDNAVASLIVQSLDGTFVTTFQMSNEMNFEPFIRTNGQTINNVKITATSKEFQHPVWAFGDSYFGIGSNRWVGVMKTFGYFNFLINGLAGQESGNAYNDLLRCLKYGTPKYIIWCLGMNDDNASYTSTLNNVISICELNSITLIISTVPTVPTRDKEVIRTTVLSKGLRYIDFYKAVGATNTGTWYTGYLDPDGVHPSNIGANALATQVLVDFPELMQYGKNL